jgi:hypothetical protein
MITLVLYIGSLPKLATWFPCGRGRTLFISGSLPLYRLIIYIDGRILWCTHNYMYSNCDLDLWPNDLKINRVLPRPQGNHVAKFGKDQIYRTKVRQQDCFRTITLVLYIGSLPNLATWFPCGRGKNPIYFGVIRSKVKVTVTIKKEITIW